MVSKFHNGINDPKEQDNIYTLVKDKETFYCPMQSPDVVKSNMYLLESVSDRLR